MHDDRELVEARLRRALRERIRPAIHPEAVPLTIEAWTAPGEPVAFAEAIAADYRPFSVGEGWARAWGTTWMRLTGTVPESWDGATVDAVVDIGFTGVGPGFTAEGLFWNPDGSTRAGLHPERRSLHLPEARAGARVALLLEAAANPPIHSPVTPLGAWDTAGDRPFYVMRRADLARRDTEVQQLVHDLDALSGLMRTLPLDDPRRTRILRTLDRAMDAIDLAAVGRTAASARALLAPALAVPARASAHKIVGVGHAHIDSAWLWPVRETVRKCARTFTNALELIDLDPDFVFVCSQAQQYAWMEDCYPELFDRIKTQVHAGRFTPVGGMWVEADMNLPSGESLARQLIHGQRYFESRFGVRCREVWIPDVFGYPGSLPQIFAAGGCDRFVTQKLSWNKQNRMPHHTFRWTGIDGTSVLSHFPPIDTYCALLIPKELAHAAANFRDAAWSDWSLMPYGHGDGGGGPTREMLERARRFRSLDGLPEVQLGTLDDFFDRVEADIAADPGALPEWRGELYFEMHRGTYTSQSNTKIGNRRAEHLLREAELWWAGLGGGPVDELDQLWKDVLLLQFHDIIPGSSIAWVYEDTERDYDRINTRLEGIVTEALARLSLSTPTVANAATARRDEVVETRAVLDGPVQQLADGKVAARLAAPGLGLAAAVARPVDHAVTIEGSRMDNGIVAIEWDGRGQLTSLRDLRRDRECFHRGRALTVELAPDLPNEYDAWDLESWARRNTNTIDDCTAIAIVDAGPLVGRVRVTRRFDGSEITHSYVVRAGSARVDVECSIDWHHRDHLLSLAFPIDVHTDVAACDIQFGYVDRPRHASTSWDAAKFEVCAHRWVDVSEADFGVAVLNNGRYGYSVQGDAVRVTLQKGAQWPDPMADDGHHEVTLALFPHGPGLVEVVHEAEALNLPLRVATGSAGTVATPLIEIDAPNVLVSALKRSDDGEATVLRVWEAVGARARLGTLPAGSLRTNLLEEPDPVQPDAVEALRPFELATWRF
jgi:alpha-mannosidase